MRISAREPYSHFHSPQVMGEAFSPLTHKIYSLNRSQGYSLGRS